MDPSTERHSIATVPKRKLVFWAAALGVGAFLGYWLAYSLTQTSTFALLGTLLVGGVIVAILFVLAIVAAAVGLQPDKRGRPAARAVVVSGLLFVVGVGIGWMMTNVLGLGYRPPVLLEANGTMSLSLDGLDGYTALGDGLAYCYSAMDSEAVASVDANVVGRIDTGTVATSVRMTPLDSPDGRPYFTVAIWPAVKAEGAAPNWQGFFDVVEPIIGDREGRIVFTGASLLAIDETERLPEGWPAELSGTVSWSCGDWVRTGSSPRP